MYLPPVALIDISNSKILMVVSEPDDVDECIRHGENEKSYSSNALKNDICIFKDARMKMVALSVHE